ncbi:hypothetical protein Tco_1269387, partial [Tanacetum coccineum]
TSLEAFPYLASRDKEWEADEDSALEAQKKKKK